MARHVVLIAGVLLASGPAAGGEKGGGLSAAVKKLSAAGSYAFTLGGKEGAGLGGTVEVKYEKGKPLYAKAEGVEFFKKGDAAVYKQGKSWVRSKRGTTSDPLRVLSALARVNCVRLPHEELAGLDKLIRKGGAVKEGDQTVTTAELTPEGVKRFVPPEHRGVAKSGTAQFWVDKRGVLTKYAVTIRLKGRKGDVEVDGMTTKVVTLQGAGATTVTVPEEAKKALE
jgi:hypothetical protein